VVGQITLEYLNNHSLHAGYINYVLHKTTIYYREDIEPCRNKDLSLSYKLSVICSGVSHET